MNTNQLRENLSDLLHEALTDEVVCGQTLRAWVRWLYRWVILILSDL